MITFEKDKAYKLFEEVEQLGYIGYFDRKWILKVNEIYSIIICYDIDYKGMYSIKKNKETIKWECGINLSFSKEKFIDELENTEELAIQAFNEMDLL